MNYNIFSYKDDLSNYENNSYKNIIFNNLNNKVEIKNQLKKELLSYLKSMNIKKSNHIFIVGLGNDNHTADSIGPKTLKHIRVNSYLEKLGIKIIGNKVSALEPGVLGETGIITERIISSVSKEIKPDLVILIDSFVSDDINNLNKCIHINNIGLNPASGLSSLNKTIDKKLLGIPVLVIGVVTSILVKFTNGCENYIPYLLCTKDIDEYVYNISKIIGEGINEVISDL